MRLYLIQHAEAKHEEEDPLRPLTEKGWTDARRVVRHAADHAGIRVGRVIHSGKLRARQTAEVWREHLASVKVTEADGLDPTADPQVWLERLEQETEEVMLVGHLPHLRRLASRLLCGDEARTVVAFQNGGIVCLQRDEEGWSLRWALTPEVV